MGTLSLTYKRRKKGLYCPRLPPTTRQGIVTHYRKKGFRTSPTLEASAGATLTFDKPLPSGGRLHVRVFEKPRHFVIKTHKDRVDPYKNALGHLTESMSKTRRNYVCKIRKRKIKEKKSWWPF